MTAITVMLVKSVHLVFMFRAVRMARVVWPTSADFVPSSLTHVPFSEIAVDLDTSKHYIQVCLWSPYVIGRPYIFSCCGLFFFLLFLSSPNLSRRRLAVYHTSAHGVVLV